MFSVITKTWALFFGYAIICLGHGLQVTLVGVRAVIENFSYIFAPAQCGVHFNGRKTFGHSLIISPDGEILNEIQNEEGVIISEIDPNLPFELRKKIPSLNSD